MTTECLYRGCQRAVRFHREPTKALAEAYFCDEHTPSWRREEYKDLRETHPIAQEREEAKARVKSKRASRKRESVEDRLDRLARETAARAAQDEPIDDSTRNEIDAGVDEALGDADPVEVGRAKARELLKKTTTKARRVRRRTKGA